VAGDEDDRHPDLGFGELRLKIQPAQAGQADVEHETARPVRPLARQKFRRRTECADAQADRPQQRLQCTAHAGVVVDDEHLRVVLWRGFWRRWHGEHQAGATGGEPTAAPPSGATATRGSGAAIMKVLALAARFARQRERQPAP
jgi:hypothetical protein